MRADSATNGEQVNRDTLRKIQIGLAHLTEAFVMLDDEDSIEDGSVTQSVSSILGATLDEGDKAWELVYEVAAEQAIDAFETALTELVDSVEILARQLRLAGEW